MSEIDPNMKQMKVSALKDGTVLDHIPSAQIFRVIDILQLADSQHQITFGINLDSKTLGKKGIIKISGLKFKDFELNKIALIAPHATVNTIENFKVVKKRQISIPNMITGIAKCMNPVCITNHEQIETKFSIIQTKEEIDLFCHYCEKITDSKNLKIITNSH